ncbi:hypothetical protein PGN35_007440 [Nodosilinea sp. PGN35]
MNQQLNWGRKNSSGREAFFNKFMPLVQWLFMGTPEENTALLKHFSKLSIAGFTWVKYIAMIHPVPLLRG